MSSATACMASERGPELPMQLMQPKPQVKKPSWRKGSVSPARSSRSSVARLPGAKMVFTQGAGASPRSAALRAMRPVASIMAWSVAVVQLVTAAMAMAPWVSS